MLNGTNTGTYTGRMEWDVQRFADRVKKKRVKATDKADDTLKKYFDQPDSMEFSEPCTFIDMHGVIMVWYLPGVLGLGRIVQAISSFTAALDLIVSRRKAQIKQYIPQFRCFSSLVKQGKGRGPMGHGEPIQASSVPLIRWQDALICRLVGLCRDMRKVRNFFGCVST
jgi:hypothetical protein